MAFDVSIKELPVRRLEAIPGAAKLAAGLLIVLGTAGFIIALMTDATRAWQAYMFNWLFWTSIAQGAVMFAAAVVIARGIWARSLRRIALSFVTFLPISFVLFIPLLLFGPEHLFPWIEMDLHGKEVWLNVPFLTARNVVLLAVLFGLSLVFAYWALRPDVGLLRDHAPSKLRGLYARLARGWRGQEEEEVRAERKMSRLAPGLALVYALAFTVVAFDFVMSLDPHWFSTLIGPYFFMGAFLGGVAATGLLALVYRATLGLEEYIEPPQIHDLGKLTFALSIFWAYMFWSQYIVIWYGKLPHEQIFLIHRLSEPFVGLSVLLLFFLFVLPFFGLLGVAPKKKPEILGTFAGVILFGLWIERYVLVYPTYYAGAEELPFSWIEVVAALPFAGLLLWSVLYFATRFPIFQVWEPASELDLLGGSTEPPAEVVTAE